MNDSARRKNVSLDAEPSRTRTLQLTLLMLPERPEDLGRVKHVVPVDDLVDVVGEQGRVEEEGDHLERQEEEDGHERVRGHFGQDELLRCMRMARSAVCEGGDSRL